MRAVNTNVLSFIGGLDKVFIIPPFHRHYEWSIEQCDELFFDIIKAFETHKSHYIGNVVYYLGKNTGASFSEFILVDGQQRITTILLLLCAIRDLINDEEVKIDSRYLKNDTKDEKFRIKLKQTSFDSLAFSNIIEGRNISESEKKSNIVKNYERFIELLKNCTIEPIEIYNTIQKLEIVDVNLEITDDLRSVQTVFEKINSTGKKLEPADLIRNYLLLSNSAEEQEQLYNNYWVKLESILDNANVSRFSRDYLITKILDDVPNENVYKMFKEYFDGVNMSHVSILEDMLKYSEYFSWLKNANSSDEKINNHIEFLNLLKTDDLYPLYLILFERLYKKNIEELRRILNLISDFMLRYRIVSPSGGGGALRTAIHDLMDKLINNAINVSYNDILFELSNSSTPANRFPTDEDFKNALMTGVNTTYARALLYKMEFIETNNIPVSLSKVTIEHLMPQTLSQWWINYYGGEEEAKRIYNQYLNCIGNLAPISSIYNIKNSNKPWEKKVENLRNVQFVITSSVSKYTDWKEEEIISRNEEISDKACNDIISPLKRSRPYETKIAISEFEPGLYPMSDIITPMNGTSPNVIVYNGIEYYIANWKDLVPTICNIVKEIDPVLFNEIVDENKIHKSTSTHGNNVKDPIITKNKELLKGSIKLNESELYVEGVLSSSRARFYAKRLLDYYELTDSFQIEVS